MLRKFLIFTSFLLLSSPAYAFAVTEGVLSLSALAGVIGTVLVGTMPTFYKNSTSKVLIAVCIGLSLLSAGSIYYIHSESSLIEKHERFNRRSKPEQESSDRSPISQVKKSELKYALENNIIIKKKEFRSQTKENSPELIYVNSLDNKYNQPWHLKRFRQDEKEKILDYIKLKEGNLIIVSNFYEDIIKLSKASYDEFGFVVRGLKLGDILVSEHLNGNDWKSEKYLLSDDVDVLSEPMVDIRGAWDFYENHSLESSINIPLYDIALMRDWEFNEKFNSTVNFVTYKYRDYQFIYNVMAERDFYDFKFYKPGLHDHIKELGLHLTKPYLNQGRVLSLGEIENLIFNKGNVKFICTEPSLCLNNIPSKYLEIVDFKALGKDTAKEVVASLDSDFYYVALTNSLSTTGNAYLMGYWLTSNNLKYSGEFSNFGSVSEELIRFTVESNGYDSLEDSLSESKSVFSLSAEGRDWLSSLDSDSVIMIVVLIIFSSKLALYPIQRLVFIRSYKETINKGFKWTLIQSLAPFLYLGTSLIIYFSVDNLITTEQIFSQSEVNKLLSLDISVLPIALALVILLQSWMNSPEDKARNAFVGVSVLILFQLNFMTESHLPVFLMFSIIVGELSSILLQSSSLILFYRCKYLEKHGLSTSPIKNSNMKYPQKWLSLAQTSSKSGILIKNNDYGKLLLDEHINKISSEKIIVRSCSSKREESNLGGYFESFVCEPKDVHSKIETLLEQGCDYSIVQGFIDADLYGVASTLSSNGQGIFVAIGSGESATEGGSGASHYVIEGTPNSKFDKLLESEISRISKVYNCAVTVEFSYSDGIFTVLQIRDSESLSSDPINKLYPYTINDFDLAQDFLAKCSVITGEVIEMATSKDYIFINGFLYKNKRTSLTFNPVTQSNVQKISLMIDDILEGLKEDEMSEQKKIEVFYDLMSIYSKLYSFSQSALPKRKMLDIYTTTSVRTMRGSELEILNNKEIIVLDEPIVSSNINREHVHSLIVKVVAGLSVTLNLIIKVDSNTSLYNVIGGKKYNYHYSDDPLFNVDSSVIVSGDIGGFVWDSNNNSLSDFQKIKELSESGSKIILVGEEIPSNWVKHFRYISGLISCYGHESSHVSISAKELNIPYKIESKKTIKEILLHKNYSI